MKPYTENEMRQIRRVYGEDVTFDENGHPIEKGVGSQFQPQVFPTKKPPDGVKPAELEFLRKMVAATASKALQLDFERYLSWRRAHPEEKTVEMPLELLEAHPDHMGIEQRKLLAFRGRLRAGDIPEPILVKAKNTTRQYIVIEGNHRVAAARAEGRKFIRAEIVKEVDPRKDRAKSFTEDREGM